MGAAEAGYGKCCAGGKAIRRARCLMGMPTSSARYRKMRRTPRLRKWLSGSLRSRGVRVVYTAVWKFLDRRGFTHKKDRSCERAGTPRRESGSPGMGRKPGRS
jgi:hypothetical protein